MSVEDDAPTPDEVGLLADLFALAADPTRLRLLAALLRGERCVCELSGEVESSVSAVSHQLRLLRAGGLVGRRREGRHVYYSLADDHVEALMTMGLSHVRE